MTGGTMVDSILLMVRGIDKLDEWAAAVYPVLNRKVGTMWLAAPEVTLLAGGLGRVMQYLSRALKEMGFDVRIVEPYRKEKFEVDEEGNLEVVDLDYEGLTLPLKIPERYELRASLKIQGKRVPIFVYKAVNDAGIPVYLYRDKKWFYSKMLYQYDQEGYPSKFSAVEFMTKATLKVIDRVERKRKERMEILGQEWLPPVIALNDGQTNMAAAWRLFHKDYQTEVLVRAHYMVTTHTYRNRIYGNYREQLINAGVPRNWLWLFKAKTLEGHELYDLTSGGVRAALLFGGFANGVSEAHANDVRRYDPQIAGLLYAVTNGDLISLTMREFGLAFVEAGHAGEDARVRVAEMELERSKANKFKRAVIQLKMDEYLYKLVWAFVDNERITRAEIKEMFRNLQVSLKRKYIELYIKPYQEKLKIKIPEEYKGREEDYWDQLARMPWVGYSGRWVWEKDGRRGAFTDDNLREAVEEGMVSIILGNVQFNYAETHQYGGSNYIANEMMALAHQLNARDNPGKLIFKKQFGLKEQLLQLMCLDIQMQDSDMEKEVYDKILEVFGTGAAEATEAHTWTHSGTAPLHGFIQLITSLFNKKKKRGSNPVPKNSHPDSYLEVYRWILEAHREGSLIDHLVDGLLHFRAIDVMMTAAGYARGWEKTVKEEEERRRRLMNRPEYLGKDIRKILIEEYKRRARPEREVAIKEVTAGIVSLKGVINLPMKFGWKAKEQ
ncbi:MAG: glycogen/starch synthase, partial [Candidatus Omnitrophica bacterium]|nr:glycogen/starch synthase [Candidatus Omnitrophota bacterium]